MTEKRLTWFVARLGPDGFGHDVRKGWCGHRHRYEDTAVACARQLNRSWASTGDRWEPREGDPWDR